MTNKSILEQKSKYLNSIRVFPFFHFNFPMKWNKQEIFKRRHEKHQKQSFQPSTLFKKRLCHKCFPVNFFEISNKTFSNRTPPVAASERWKIVKAIIVDKFFYTSYWKQGKWSLCKERLYKCLSINSCSVNAIKSTPSKQQIRSKIPTISAQQVFSTELNPYSFIL